MNTADSFNNLCSHDIVVTNINGKKITLHPSGEVCRVKVLPKDVHYHHDIAISRDVYGDVENLPAPKKGIIYIVSAKVLNALNGSRIDVVSPGRQIKDDNTGRTGFSVGLRRKF